MPVTTDAPRHSGSPAPGSPTLVASKLSPPRLLQASIRSGLLAKVAEGAQKRLLLISAPAGYGKSTLIVHAAQQLGWVAAWYKLDVLDHDPMVLVASLTEAIRRQAPGFGDVVNERLSNIREIPISVPELLALFVHELEDEVKLTLHLILDDYHEASASTELNEALDFLLANLPSHIHAVLLTRFEPSFSIAKLRLEDEIAELRYEDLRLDAEQIRSVFLSRAGARVPMSTAERLEELTEGWPVSVILAARALQWSQLPAIEVALRDPRLKNDAFSYLAEQVFRREDDSTRAFLKQTSCLEYMTPALADEITGGDNATGVLEYLEKNQVFTFADERRKHYRLHPLFRDYLRQKCAQENGARRFHDLQLKAARAMERVGDTGVAIEIYLTANEAMLALDCLAGAAELALENCALDTMRSWLARVPADVKRGSAWAALLAGHIELREGRFDAAVTAFRSAEASFASVNDVWGRYQAASAIETALFWKGDTVGAAAECRRAIEFAPTEAKRAHSLISLGAALMDEAQWDECESLWSQAESLLSDTVPAEGIRVACMRAFADYIRGDFSRAVEKARPILIPLRENGPRIMEASFLNALGTIEMHLGHYPDAEGYIRESLAVGSRYGFNQLEHMALDTLGQVLMGSGHSERGLKVLETASRAQTAEDRPLRALTLSHIGTANRRAGSLREACVFYEEGASLVSERFPYPYFTCLANLWFTRGLLGDGETAIGELQAVATGSNSYGLLFMQLKCDFFVAVLRSRARPGGDALESLQATVTTQLRLGHIHFLSQELCLESVLLYDLLRCLDDVPRRSLIDAVAVHPQALRVFEDVLTIDPDLASVALQSAAANLSAAQLSRLLRRASRSRSAAVRRFAGRLATSSTEGEPRPAFHYDLTKRELQILSMMASGMRNDEIASTLVLAPSTVKTHVNRVFGKLGVSDRVHAVLLYRDLVDGVDRPER